MTPTSSVLVLFDIDGTLVHTLGAGMRGLNRAFERLFGVANALGGVPVAGRTDCAIVTEAFERAGVAFTPERMAALRESYLLELPGAMAESLEPGFGVLPGVHAALAAIEADSSFTLALLTGNFVEGAAIKLGHFDLWRRFTFGAFGDRHVNRRDLVPVAVAEAAARGVTASDVVIIGDTPLDVDCAHAHGALAVAVATGHYDQTALAATGADLVVPTLESLAPAAQRLRQLCVARRG